jgi:CMP-N-acetylneuraminic acid synthetase
MEQVSLKKPILLGVIPARSGSKGLKNKNLRLVLNRPLISYTIEHACSYQEIFKTIVTTDSNKIAKISKQYGAEIPFIRPKKLAEDSTGMLTVLKHALLECERRYSVNIDGIVLFDPTSPMREKRDVREMIRIFRIEKPDLIVAVTKSKRNPYFNMLKVNESGYSQTVLRGKYVTRQETPVTYDITNNCWIFSRRAVLREWRLPRKTIGYEINSPWIDIDKRNDLRCFEIYLKSQLIIGK